MKLFALRMVNWTRAWSPFSRTMLIQVNCDLAILVLVAIEDCSPDGGKNLVFLDVLLRKKAVLRVLRLDSS